MSRRQVDEALTLWKTSHNVQDWQKYVFVCVAFLLGQGGDPVPLHWFCTTDAELRSYASSSLALLSYSPDTASDAGKLYHTYSEALTACLGRCTNCAIAYEQALPRLLQSLLDELRLPTGAVRQFGWKMAGLDRQRLTTVLTGPASDAAKIVAANEALYSLSCMNNGLFLSSVRSVGLWKSPQIMQHLPQMAPGFVTLLFSVTPEEHHIGKTKIQDCAELFRKQWNRVHDQMLGECLQKYHAVAPLADMAWFNAAVVLDALDDGNSSDRRTAAVREIVRRFSRARAGASYGAQLLLARLLQGDGPVEDVEACVTYAISGPGNLGPRRPLSAAPESSRADSEYVSIPETKTWWWFAALAARRPPARLLTQAAAFWFDVSSDAFPDQTLFHEALVQILESIPVSGNYELLVRHAKTLVPVLIDMEGQMSSNKLHVLGRILEYEHGQNHSTYFESFVPGVVASSDPRLFTGFLVGARYVALGNGLKHLNRGGSTTPPPLQMSEICVQRVLDSLSERPALASQVVESPDGYAAVALMSCSGTASLAFAAMNMVSEIGTGNDEEDAPNYLSTLLQRHPRVVVEATANLLKECTDNSHFGVFMGLLKHSKLVLEALFDPLAPLSESQMAELNSSQLVVTLWRRSWEFVQFVVLHVRPWATVYRVAVLRALLCDLLEFCDTLLAKFRLVEDELPPATSEGAFSWGSVLAEPAVACVEKMQDLLALNFAELLAQAHAVILKLIGLMRSFHVTIPAATLQQIKLLASRRMVSKLSDEQLEALLEAAHCFNDDQISSIMEGSLSDDSEVSRSSQSSSGQASQASPQSLSQTQLRPRQRQMEDFFRRAPGSTATSVTPRPEYAPAGVPVHAPPPQTQMEQIRMQMATSRRQLAQQAAAPRGLPPQKQAIEVHPPRPAGFNSRRQLGANEDRQRAPRPPDESSTASPATDDASSDDSDAGQGMLEALGNRIRNIDRFSKTKSTLVRPQRMQTPSERDVELRRMRARLLVDASGLHEAILSWDWFGKGAYPVGFDSEKRSVPDRFTSIQEYESVMEPLLHLEAWQQILRARDDPERPFLLNVGRRVACDSFTDMYANVAASTWTDSRVGDGDLVVLAYNSQDPKPDRAVRPRPGMAVCLARVKDQTVRTRGDHVDLELRMFEPRKMLPYLVPGSTLHVMKVCPLTTVEREYCSLKALAYYDLQPQILQAEPAPVKATATNSIREIQNNLRVNESQARAVRQATTAPGFSLIQGPPGTGKTMTILGVLGAYFASGSSARRVLVCAPSNAAVDEIVMRLKDGVPGGQNGAQMPLRVVRLGRPEAVNQQVRHLSLEQLVTNELSGVSTEAKNASPSTETNRLRQELRELVARRNKLRETDPRNRNEDDELRRLTSLVRTKQLELGVQRDQTEQLRRQRDVDVKAAQRRILTNAQIVCSTLSGSAHSLLASLELSFPAVVIDEAAQCVELSALIPLKYGAKHCVMVGDPNQLPPTVISQEAARLRYDQSLFVRMFRQHSSTSVCMLDTQFRMHPDIAGFPSSEFYHGKLHTAPGMAEKTKREWHTDPVFGPYRFFAVEGKQERQNATRSLSNVAEAEAAVVLVSELLDRFAAHDFTGGIGVISSYKEQVRVLRDRFIRRFGSKILEVVDFNTVDGFQGQEKDVIVMSCVRASADVDGVGFLGDTRRMNVAITRARSSLWILGHPASLRRNAVWERLISDADRRGCFFSTARPRSIYADAKREAAQKHISGTRETIDYKAGTTDAGSRVNTGVAGDDPKVDIGLDAMGHSGESANTDSSAYSRETTPEGLPTGSNRGGKPSKSKRRRPNSGDKRMRMYRDRTENAITGDPQMKPAMQYGDSVRGSTSTHQHSGREGPPAGGRPSPETRSPEIRPADPRNSPLSGTLVNAPNPSLKAGPAASSVGQPGSNLGALGAAMSSGAPVSNGATISNEGSGSSTRAGPDSVQTSTNPTASSSTVTHGPMDPAVPLSAPTRAPAGPPPAARKRKPPGAGIFLPGRKRRPHPKP